jgi:acyl-CoA hydrolase
MDSKTVSKTHVRMSQVMTPNDANLHGTVFGGALMAMVDLAAYTAASRFAGNVCVTAAFDRVEFHEPIQIGEVVTMDAFVSYAGRTSIEVTVHVYAGNILTGVETHTNTAHVTMVAMKDGKPTPVPSLVCETREDKIRFLEGKLRREMRKVQNLDVDRMREGFLGATDEQLDDLLDAPKLI